MVTPTPSPYKGEFLRGVVGSTVYGLQVTGTDDLDLMGICIEPPEASLSMGQPFEQHVFRTQPQNEPSGPGDVDLTVYSLRKWLRLASKGNPSILNLLFVPPEFRYLDTPLADQLRELTPLIVSRQAAWRYRGYLRSQRERLVGERGQKRTGYARRLKYLSEDGWDTKYGMHMIRLGVQGIELMTTGKIELPMSEPNRLAIGAVRAGNVTIDEVVAWAEVLEHELETLGTTANLPERPDNEHLNAWLVGTYLGEWTWPRQADLRGEL